MVFPGHDEFVLLLTVKAGGPGKTVTVSTAFETHPMLFVPNTVYVVVVFGVTTMFCAFDPVLHV
jgi:hypothetical protein